MIQNILTFCVKNDLTFVEGSIPSGKLVANDINRNSIYLVTPYDEAIVKANFQTNLQSDKPTSVLGILVNGKITIDEIVPTSKSYYNLVKDWNIYEFKVPSTTLSFISRNRTGKIGINFSIEQRLVPTIKDSYGEYQGEILSLGQVLTESGYYINKTIGFELDTGVDIFTYGLNDILVLTKQESPLDDIQVKISAYSNRGSTPTAMYSVDPSLLNDNFETIEPSLTFQILQQVNDNTGDIVLLFQNVGINNDTLVDLENRISVAEQDIDKIEDGTTIVGKALADSLGNILKDYYVGSVYPTYNDTTDKLYIETLNSQDGLLANNEVILPKATTTKNGLMAKEDKVKVDNIASDIASMGATKQSLSEKNQINGYAGLDGNAKIPTILLPDSILGQLEYKGTFDPSSGYPTTPEKGWFYISIGNASISGVDYKIGDWAVYNGSSWDKVDNTDAVASVNGKLGVVVINGTEIQVGNGDTWTIEQRIVNIYAELNNRYTKTQTYSNTEIEQRLTDLLGLANLQDTAIEKSAGVFVFDNGDSLLASSLAQYNWVICRFYNVDGGVQNVRYNMFKPSEATSGNRTIVQIDRTPVRYAEIKRDNGNILFRVVDESDTFDNTYVCTMKMWGIKLDGITASEISYDGTISGLSSTNVKTAIDELASEKAEENYVKNISANQVYYAKNIKDEISISPSKNFVSSSNLAPIGGSLTYSGGILKIKGNGTSANVSAYETYGKRLGQNVYYRAKIRTTNTDTLSIAIYCGGNGDLEILSPIKDKWYEISKTLLIQNNNTDFTFLIQHRYIDGATANNKEIEVEYYYCYDMNTMISNGIMSDEDISFGELTTLQIKSQLDLWFENGYEFGKFVEDKIIEIDRKNSLYGKKLIFAGDSITAGTGYKSYGQIVAEKNGMVYTNDGISGSTLSNVVGNNPYVIRYLLKDYADIDYLTIWFGWNDSTYSTVGTITDSIDTTFYGAYNIILGDLITRFPSLKIGLIVPYGASVQIRQAVRDIGDKFGLAVLDLYSKDVPMFYGREATSIVDSGIVSLRRSQFTYDGTHPNQAGYDFLSTIFEDFIRKL